MFLAKEIFIKPIKLKYSVCGMWAVYGGKKKISIVFSSRCTFPQIGITFPQEKSYVSANLYITFPLISPIVSQIKLPVAPAHQRGCGSRT